MHYFAYGSNCDPFVMERKGVAYTSRRRAVLRHHRLLFNKKAYRKHLPDSVGYANINDDPKGHVEGVLYEINAGHLDLLDQSERYPDHYDRIRTVVETDDGVQECFAYRAQPHRIATGLVPLRDYLDHILTADGFFSRPYREALAQAPTYRAKCACCHSMLEVVFLRDRNGMHPICQPCRESRIVWGDTVGRPLTVAEAESVMMGLVKEGPGFSSIAALVQEAVTRGLIAR